MKSLFLLIPVMAMSHVSYASDYMTVTEKLTSDKYTAEIEYPVLKVKDAADEARYNINKQVREAAAEGCGLEDAIESPHSFDHSATVKVVTLNKNFVTYKSEGSSYCGGAHPNHFMAIYTYDIKTGEALDMSQEVPRQNWQGENVDWDDREKFQLEIAAIMLKAINADNDENGCYLEGSEEERLEALALSGPGISGLSSGKKVILRNSPSHAMSACMLTVEVPYAAVKSYFKKDSKIHTWLK